ncbi:MAG TPA: hypothetical protein VFX74_07480, partial [Candidatus Limnocylindria bacterium]|nr:hypothetical protein [Candidatus Limnocylindria bacterium]
VGAREGRARLMLELLAVEPADQIVAAPTQPARQAAAALDEGPRAAPPVASAPAAPSRPQSPVPVGVAAAPPRPVAVPRGAPPRTAPLPESAAAPVGPGSGDRPNVEAVQGRWSEVIERASPAIKPLVRECRPVGQTGARLTLGFPEERAFMREKAATRAASIEQLLGTVFGGSWAIECVASNVDLQPLSVEQAVAPNGQDPDAAALLKGVLEITGGQLVDVPEVR